MVGGSDIKVTCRKCGRSAPADKFVLDNAYKMVVCPSCVNERRDKDKVLRTLQEKKVQETEELKKKPAGWDAEDVYLEKAHKAKEAEIKVLFERLDVEKVRYSCPKCNYTFVYNTVKKVPNLCPYCGEVIHTSKIR